MYCKLESFFFFFGFVNFSLLLFLCQPASNTASWEESGGPPSAMARQANNFVCLDVIVFRLIIEYSSSSSSRDFGP